MSWRLDPAKAGVLLIDLQERLVPAIHGGERIVKKAGDLLSAAELFGIPVFATEQVPEKLGPTVAALEFARRGIAAIPKVSFSAASVLPKELPPTVIVAGVEAHVCVRQTVYDLRLGGRTVIVPGDATGSRHPDDHRLALAEMRHDGVLVQSVEALAFELAGGADSPRFKALLAIFK